MATKTLMSFADFERLDQGADKIELLKGELIRVPPARNLHMDICELLFKLVAASADRLRQEGHVLPFGKVHMERGYRFPGDPPSWLQPDVSITHPDQPFDENYYLGAPLIAFEIVSPSDTAAGLNGKVAAFLANGAAEVWLIYPEQREAWVYEGPAAARKETQIINSPLIPGIDVPLPDVLK